MTYMPPVPPPLNYAPTAPDSSSAGRLVAWTVIIVSVAAIALNTWRHSSAPKVNSPSARVDIQIDLSGKYAVGANGLLGSTGQPKSAAPDLLKPLDANAATPLDKLAVVTVDAEINGPKAAVERLDKIGHEIPPDLADAAGSLRKLYSDEPSALSDPQKRELMNRLGWFGQLALSHGLPADNPQRESVMSAAHRAMGLVFGGLAIAGVGLVVGIGLLIFLLIALADRKIQRQYWPLPAGGGIFLEAFAIYVAGLTAVEMGVEHLPTALRRSIPFEVGLMFIPTVLAMVWPLLRGADVRTWRLGLGWHFGRGFFREMGLGIVGYTAGLPILAVGFLIMFVLIHLAHANPSHPIDRMIGINNRLTLIVIALASVYAPITEETMFRGAFFHALRSRHGWLFSAAVSSFIFAAIHPQGWTVIPALMSIAIVFAGIREWRATVVASATAHCLHNTMLVVFMLLAMN